ncbi:PREDICTED: squamosa promoter-binding-like protein 14 [Nelumbo nucifera]|uniref:SBP-type domain-containing protein n=2 Tax=Nelumbo nucifera TaxID=4432 RepID=A0A822Z045_NELNU|nr:PREDICTED: squamosa promoter-binding-like protein 14 [Nelumbo nucifera]DAD34838.1 TPA_asm: hypothetical protein HUJ06_005478 [Nelumbo nucifera]
MEDVGAQVFPPIFIHQALPGRFCEAPAMAKKRDLPWQSPNFQQQQQQHQRFNSVFQSSKGNWNPSSWDWDSMMFVAKPSETEVLHLGTAAVVESEQKKKGEETLKNLVVKKGSVDEDGEKLTLKLGGGLYSVDESAARPNKRVRSGSPGSGNYPMCQVDDCKGDLSNAKDYHRRHKVCEFHSKTTKALVGGQMQRFCQQCSRFHPLSEFDEGKRSCRRRLAGHNRRRRKTQPEDASSRLLGPGNRENSGTGNMDVVNLLTILSRLQGNNVDRSANASSLPDRERLIQILNKINASPISGNSGPRLPVPGSFDLNVSQEASSDNLNKINGNTSSPSTMDLLAVLSAALAASNPDALALLSQINNHSYDGDKSKLNSLDQADGSRLQNKPISRYTSIGGERNNGTFQSPVGTPDCHAQIPKSSLPFQLFSSSPEGGSPPKLGSSRRYFSSESSNPMEERSPSSSPVVQKLFPLHAETEILKHERMSISGEDNATVETSTTRDWTSPLELFKGQNGRVGNGSVQSLQYQGGYTSSSGSDHSPSSSNSDAQDRTGRIIFKLFDKDPSNFPGTLRSQILNWLSHSPSEMESYIRPGCVVLSVYVSMPSTAWEHFQKNLFHLAKLLVQGSASDFWRNGRFLVHTDRQLVSHKDGKIRLCKAWRTWSAPELISVSPLAVVGGEETSLVLKGRNLTAPGTKIHCTYLGGYKTKEVPGSTYQVAMYDDTSFERFKFPGGAPGVLGRCFIEVENGFKGNCFPVIIADATICQELRGLESEFDQVSRTACIVTENKFQDLGRPQSREDVLHFLNELGWLFQRKSNPSKPEGPNFSHSRFKFIFTFSVERDWCAVVKTLLDILVEKNLGPDGPPKASIELLSDIQLLNRAVKRKCRNMVDLLIHYSVTLGDNTKQYLFPPNSVGPGGVTPLHLAACIQGLEEIVDSLTNDPQQIGLKCWNSLPDANGQTPFTYSLMRNNHSYNRMVARKLAERKRGQVSIPVGDEISLDQSWIIDEQADKPLPETLQGRRSCARCAVVATRYYKRMPGSQGLLHRPYVHSMLAIAAVCVCVCLFLRGSPDIGSVAPFKWENLDYGWS